MKANSDQRQIMRCNYSRNNNEMGGQTKRIEYCNRQNWNIAMNAKNIKFVLLSAPNIYQV